MGGLSGLGRHDVLGGQDGQGIQILWIQTCSSSGGHT